MIFPAVLIPAYNPDSKLVNLVFALEEKGFSRLLIINDGSKPECREFFDALRARPSCTVLVHERNRGKGRALKTGLEYFCAAPTPEQFVITADADGQHDPDSIIAVANTLQKNPQSLVLGVRNFSKSEVPAANRMGNLLTVKVVSLLMGQKISDTQTGLRGMNRELAKDFLAVEGERYEYETNVLLACKKKYRITETPIKTIYLDNNKSSHFNRLWDSLSIYFQFIKFASSSLGAMFIDVLGFYLLLRLFNYVSLASAVFFATLFARAVSMFFNYYVNHKKVFHSQKKKIATLIPYIILAAANIYVSAYLIDLALAHTALGPFLLKIIVNFLLFFVNYYIQKKWVF